MKGILLVLALSILPALTHAEGGYGEIRGNWQVGAEGEQWQLVERFRPRFTVELAERWALFSELEVALRQGRNQLDEVKRVVQGSDLGPILESAGYQWPQEENDFLKISRAQDYLEVARLYVDWYHPSFDFRVGRQSIYWGSAAFLNPTDPFPEFLIAEPWRPRRGLNAGRISIPIGEDSDLMVVLGGNDTFTHFRAASRFRTTAALADISVVGAYRGDDGDGLIGIDLRGTYGVGYWVESALWSSNWASFDVAVGFDYSVEGLFEGLIVMAQYYYNGRGTTDVTASASSLGLDLDALAGNTMVDTPSFGPILQGKHYGMTALTLALSMDTTLGTTGILNLVDHTGFFVPSLTHRPNDWLEFSITGQVPLDLNGEGGEFLPSDSELVFRQSLIEGGEPVEVDFSSLRSKASITVWSRFSY
ncbi:MAG: hypothetical protein VX210_17210 [Myxococcota bacterium]|nr:hypothetical protein [Myxococcota bacterium]